MLVVRCCSQYCHVIIININDHHHIHQNHHQHHPHHQHHVGGFQSRTSAPLASNSAPTHSTADGFLPLSSWSWSFSLWRWQWSDHNQHHHQLIHVFHHQTKQFTYLRFCCLLPTNYQIQMQIQIEIRKKVYEYYKVNKVGHWYLCG